MDLRVECFTFTGVRGNKEGSRTRPKTRSGSVVVKFIEKFWVKDGDIRGTRLVGPSVGFVYHPRTICISHV